MPAGRVTVITDLNDRGDLLGFNYDPNTDDPVEIERRLRNARREVLNIGKYQYALINDDLDLAFSQLQSIVNAEKQRTTRFCPTILED